MTRQKEITPVARGDDTTTLFSGAFERSEVNRFIEEAQAEAIRKYVDQLIVELPTVKTKGGTGRHCSAQLWQTLWELLGVHSYASPEIDELIARYDAAVDAVFPNAPKLIFDERKSFYGLAGSANPGMDAHLECAGLELTSVLLNRATKLREPKLAIIRAKSPEDRTPEEVQRLKNTREAMHAYRDDVERLGLSYDTDWSHVDALCVEPKRKPTAAFNDVAFGDSNTMPTANAHYLVDRCQQLAEIYALGGDVSEPIWFSALTVLARATPNLSVECSDGYPGYSKAELDGRMERIFRENRKPSTCARFEDLNPSGCVGCRFKGKIHSPAALGYEHLPRLKGGAV